MMPMKFNKPKNYIFTNQVLLVKPFVGSEADSKPRLTLASCIT